MTKEELIRLLEPFSDDIKIVLVNEENYELIPMVFYTHKKSEAVICLSARDMTRWWEKTVKLTR